MGQEDPLKNTIQIQHLTICSVPVDLPYTASGGVHLVCTILMILWIVSVLLKLKIQE